MADQRIRPVIEWAPVMVVQGSQQASGNRQRVDANTGQAFGYPVARVECAGGSIAAYNNVGRPCMNRTLACDYGSIQYFSGNAGMAAADRSEAQRGAGLQNLDGIVLSEYKLEALIAEAYGNLKIRNYSQASKRFNELLVSQAALSIMEVNQLCRVIIGLARVYVKLHEYQRAIQELQKLEKLNLNLNDSLRATYQRTYADAARGLGMRDWNNNHAGLPGRQVAYHY